MGEETSRLNAELLVLDPDGIGASIRGTVMHADAAPLGDAHRRRFPSPTPVTVHRSDTLDFAVEYARAGGRTPAVLNMACAAAPGGGWRHGRTAQEECLFYRSTYDLSLSDPHGADPLRTWRYPIPPRGVVYSPDVLVYRAGADDGWRVLKNRERRRLSFVAVAAIKDPPLDRRGLMRPEDSDLTRDKMRTALRVAALHDHDSCVLGALGCGAYHNPPEQVAALFRDVIAEPEFEGVFRELAFAVVDGPRTDNYRVFARAFA